MSEVWGYKVDPQVKSFVEDLEKENAELREFKDSAMPVLENLLFWDTVPDQWKEVISELVKGGSEDELN